MKKQLLGVLPDEKIRQLINENSNWHLTEVSGAEAAVEKFQQIDFDVVFHQEGSITGSQEKMLKKFLQLKNHDSLWISYPAGNEIELVKDIAAFFAEKRSGKSNISIIDNGFQNPGITIE